MEYILAQKVCMINLSQRSCFIKYLKFLLFNYFIYLYHQQLSNRGCSFFLLLVDSVIYWLTESTRKFGNVMTDETVFYTTSLF